MKHIITTEQFDRKAMDTLFACTESLLKDIPTDALKGKIMAALFYEPSTRTRFSFESAMQRLGGSVISTENASEFSSAAKGETLEDTIRTVNGYVDVIVLRHPEIGSAARAASVSSVPLINAGDGAGSHPTQALLDLFTIQKELGSIEGKKIALVGDLKYGRASRSLAHALINYPGVELTFVSPPELSIDEETKNLLKDSSVAFSESDALEDVLPHADVIYQTRIQKERFPTADDYLKFKGRYIITRALADTMKEKSIIMHPLPRVDEITPDTDSSPHARYFEQVRYGMFVRMALLLDLLS